MNPNKIFCQRETSIGKHLIKDLLEEYNLAKKKQIMEDWSDSLVHYGKFVELSMAVIKQIYDGNVDRNKINFEKFYKDFTERTKNTPQEEMFLLVVPNVAKATYTIRNKEDVAHTKEIDPRPIDCMVSSTISDWILSQFVRFYCRLDVKTTAEFIHSIMERSIPLIERFEDDSMMVLVKEIGFKDELLVLLYYKDERVAKDNLPLVIPYRQLLTITLANLTKNRLIHKNDHGIKITQLGKKEAIKIISKYASMPDKDFIGRRSERYNNGR